MKHLLNDLTEEEKNAIREQHTGGMKVMNENFSKLVNTKLGDVKPLVNEQMSHQEPIDVQLNKIKPDMGGKYCFGKQTLQQLKTDMGDRNLLLYKIKSGDTLSGISAQHPGTVSESELINYNKGCQLSSGVKAGDVLIMVIIPSM